MPNTLYTKDKKYRQKRYYIEILKEGRKEMWV